jgi:hypothetical protein
MHTYYAFCRTSILICAYVLEDYKWLYLRAEVLVAMAMKLVTSRVIRQIFTGVSERKMEAATFSETVVNIYQNTRYHIPKDSNRHDNRKWHPIVLHMWWQLYAVSTDLKTFESRKLSKFFPCPHCTNLKMEATRFSGASVNIYQTILRQIPAESIRLCIRLHHCSYKLSSDMG